MNATHPAPDDVMAYVDGALTDGETRDVAAHLIECRACSRLEAGFREDSRQMREWRVEEPPTSFVAPRRRRQRAQWRMWTDLRNWNPVPTRSLVAGAAVAVVIAAVTVFSPAPKAPSILASSSAAESIEFPAEPPQMMDAVSRVQGVQGMAGNRLPPAQVATGPRIVRTATLRMVAGDFDRVRPALDRILQRVGGFAGGITASDRPGQPRSIRGSLRIPSAQFETALTELRGLGRVTDDSQNAEDVTATAADLNVRLVNARVTEKRLSEVLQNRTGRVADVLDVEREMARVRTEIEQMESQRKQLESRVEYATVTVEIVEARAAAVNLGPVPIPERLRHAIADGVESAAMSMMEATLFVLRRGPALLLWTIVFGLPSWWVIRKYAVRGVQRPGGV